MPSPLVGNDEDELIECVYPEDESVSGRLLNCRESFSMKIRIK